MITFYGLFQLVMEVPQVRWMVDYMENSSRMNWGHPHFRIPPYMTIIDYNVLSCDYCKRHTHKLKGSWLNAPKIFSVGSAAELGAWRSFLALHRIPAIFVENDNFAV